MAPSTVLYSRSLPAALFYLVQVTEFSDEMLSDIISLDPTIDSALPGIRDGREQINAVISNYTERKNHEADFRA